MPVRDLILQRALSNTQYLFQEFVDPLLHSRIIISCSFQLLLSFFSITPFSLDNFSGKFLNRLGWCLCRCNFAAYYAVGRIAKPNPSCTTLKSSPAISYFNDCKGSLASLTIYLAIHRRLTSVIQIINDDLYQKWNSRKCCHGIRILYRRICCLSIKLCQIPLFNDGAEFLYISKACSISTILDKLCCFLIVSASL